MNNFWNRVDSLRERQGMTQARLAKKINKSLRTVEDWKKRQYVPTGEVCVVIAKLFDTSVEFLITGEELPMWDDPGLETSDYLQTYTQKGPIEFMSDEEATIVVPIVPQVLSAGPGESFLDASFENRGHVRILERMARGLDPTTLVAAIVKGDSMTGVQIFSGDVVIFARGYLDENGLYVVSLRGDVLVKRLEFDRIHQQVIIISENKNYNPIRVSADDEGIMILGKVVGWVHCHPF